MKAMPPDVKRWALAGKAESERRPGSVDVDNGSPSDYRGLMTSLEQAGQSNAEQ